MQYILTPAQMRALEDRAFDLGAPSLLLMENAARACFDALSGILGKLAGKHILFLIGSGNNGGDGLALARLCALSGAQPRLVLLGQPKTADAIINHGYTNALKITEIFWDAQTTPDSLSPFPDAVVDAVYGTGFHSSLSSQAARLFDIVNAWDIPKIAIDVPSGLNCETGQMDAQGLHATHTLALGHLKTGHALARPLDALGEVSVLPIGIPQQAYEALQDQSLLSALEASDLPARLPHRARDAHKGSHGRVLLYMGSLGLAGAAGLAALACLRTGAGMVTIACEREIIPILQFLVPGATCIPIDQAVSSPPRHDVLAVGSGLSKSEAIWRNILALWDKEKPSLWDADALNLLAQHPMKLGDKAVLTPHPGEAARLLGCEITQITDHPLTAAQDLQARYGGTVVLKGAHTFIYNGHQSAVNLVGSPALAKGGSGDALAGIIAGLIAQQATVPVFESARTGCLWHGLAGQLAGQEQGLRSALTTDVIDSLGLAVQGLQRS